MSEGPGVFAEQLRRFRERAALTQEELAERAGVTAKAIGALERGERRRPYPHTVRALADALGLGDADRDALSAAARPAAPPEPPVPPGVPLPAAPLIGRSREREELAALLTDGTTRLVTLTGPGGVGKTTLALDVARAASSAVTVVELAPVGEARLVVPTLARALGVRQLADPLIDAVAAHLGSRDHLVVLDNVEHVLDAAGDVAELLRRAPGLTVLATSRAPLRIRAERDYPLAPLPVPGSTHPDDVGRSPAARVFLDRARAAGRDIALDRSAPDVAAICRRLDGLPLALELAAAHARFLDPAALLARLDRVVGEPRSRDLPQRQRTIRATLDWSHDLLTSAEQVLLRRLSVFAGGFRLEAAEHVSGGDVLPALEGLVEQSLVVAEHGRYRLLEPIRQYAAAKLAEAGETAVIAGSAADFFLDLAADARAGLKGPDQGDWLDRLQAEHGNLGAAFAHLLQARRYGDAALLGVDTWMYWALRGNAVEGLGWLARVPDDGLDAPERAGLDVAVAALRYASGDIPGIVAPAARAVSSATEVGDDELLAEALVLGGSAAVFLGDAERASRLVAEARDVAARSGSRWAQAHGAQLEAQRLIRSGAPAGAGAVLDEAERVARELGSPFTLATVLNAQASLARVRGEDDAALAHLLEVVQLAAGIRTTWNTAYALPDLGALAAERGQPELAAELFGAAAEAAATTVAVPPDPEHASRLLNAVRAELGEEAFRRAWERGRRVEPADVPGLAARITRVPA
ncbi:ATP-binding protein [Geodermatophilus sp. SYSU D00815]